MEQLAPAAPATGRVRIAAGDLQFLVVLLAACLPLRPSVSGLPLSTLAAAMLVLLATWRPPVPGRTPKLVGAAVTVLVVWLVGTSAVFGDLDVRRSGNLFVLLGLAYVLGQGRLHMPSFVAGLALGWFGGIAHAILTRENSSYDGRITGFLGDPNGAGFVIVTLGCLLIAYARPLGRRTWPIWLVMGVAVALTLSRTSTFAFVAATIWALVGPRLGRLASLVLLLVAAPVYAWLVDVARAAGFFSERAGSDYLRQRLGLVEGGLVDQAGWHGFGLGTAHTEVDGVPLWFHNSYRALWVEGGYLAIALLALALVALLWSVHQVPVERRNSWYESAILAGLICSLNIGFSLTSVTMAVAVGMYVLYWRQATAEPPDDTPVPGDLHLTSGRVTSR